MITCTELQTNYLCFQVDLTSQKGDATLAMWEDHLRRLEKSPVFVRYKEIQAARSESTVRKRAYKQYYARKQPVLLRYTDSVSFQCGSTSSKSSSLNDTIRFNVSSKRLSHTNSGRIGLAGNWLALQFADFDPVYTRCVTLILV